MSAACPYCRGQFEADDGIKLCPACATPHHKDCFTENGGCTVFGCIHAPGDEPKIRILVEDLGDLPASTRLDGPAPPRVEAPATPRRTHSAEGLLDLPLPNPRFGIVLRRARPAPPNLPWGLLLMLSILSLGLFQLVWDIALARWMRAVQPQSRALYYYSAVVVLHLVALAGVAGGRINDMYAAALPSLGIAIMVLCLMGRFSMRKSLEDYFDQTGAMGLSLSEGMTLLFGSIYFQYHLNRTTRLEDGPQQAIA